MKVVSGKWKSELRVEGWSFFAPCASTITSTIFSRTIRRLGTISTGLPFNLSLRNSNDDMWLLSAIKVMI